MSLLINPYYVIPAVPPGPSTPDGLANLVRWYKSDSYSLADGDPVGGVGRFWLDQSPAAPNDATQLEDNSFRPTFRTNVFGALPALQFTSAALSFMTMPALTIPGDLTIIVIGKYTTSSLILGKRDANVQVRMGRSSANTISFFPNGGSDTISDVFATAENSVRMMTYRRNAGPVSYREQNISRGTLADATISFILDTIGICDGGLQKTNGHFGEICIYTQYHTDADVDALYTNYFKTRWGLP